ncbi:acetylpolyamine aminohydrolase [Lentibacillus kapialis]|uniref:Acetylpolyamine aminohydrolase n=1 Tax=Lentibacillus kapialis TaxID=340214 RepID=A0A917PZS8_9BACI|nr:class II histone deacetylase [Lentibacillus kapialis]GGK02009.1 acetylpolyamine aminohydrolase [Lentibacillus kapialis]
MSVTTGFICDEGYFWHQTGNGALNLSSGGWIQADTHAENPETKRRARNLLERTGFMDELKQIAPRSATCEEIGMNHGTAYIDRIKKLSDAGGGDAGVHAIVGPDTYEIALKSAGGVLTSVEAVMEGKVQNVYALVRPPGHHAEPEEGMGFCLFNNVAIAAKYARRRYGLKRILILDWDVHHGNGTETAFENDSDVLFISVHQEHIFPKGRGDITYTGKGQGEGYNVNIELPAGTGNEGYLYAFDQLVEPIIEQYAPELIFISAGQDASRFDPIGRMLLTTDGYFKLTDRVKKLAEKHSNGRLIAAHEGGYSTVYVPFCTLRVIEALRGKHSQVEDPFDFGFHEGPIYQHQKEAVQKAADVQKAYWTLI